MYGGPGGGMPPSPGSDVPYDPYHEWQIGHTQRELDELDRQRGGREGAFIAEQEIFHAGRVAEDFQAWRSRQGDGGLDLPLDIDLSSTKSEASSEPRPTRKPRRPKQLSSVLFGHDIERAKRLIYWLNDEMLDELADRPDEFESDATEVIGRLRPDGAANLMRFVAKALAAGGTVSVPLAQYAVALVEADLVLDPEPERRAAVVRERRPARARAESDRKRSRRWSWDWSNTPLVLIPAAIMVAAVLLLR